MSEWSPWGPCSKKRKVCGFWKGSEERTRRVLHAPGGDHTTCTDIKETRKCTVRRTPCPEGQKRRKGGQGRRENANRHTARKNSKEPGANSRRRKGQQQQSQPGTAGPLTSVGPT
ncbi:R-spondin-1 [Sigmodon hispidus]